MAKYTIISDIGKGVLNMLRDKLVPEPINKSESIGICEPKERGGYIVGIHPYDIKEDVSGKTHETITLPDGRIQDPPALVELYYMISVSSKAELEAKALDEAKIMGKIIQVFKDNAVIPSLYMPNNIGMPLENVPISTLPLNMEEKVKVWTMFGESYKLSVFYVIGPVAIDSEKIHKPTKRVESVFIASNHYVPEQVLDFATRIKEEDIDDEYTQRPEEDEEEESDSSEDDSSNDDSSYDDSSNDDSSDNDSSNDDSSDNDSSDDDSSDDDSSGDI